MSYATTHINTLQSKQARQRERYTLQINLYGQTLIIGSMGYVQSLFDAGDAQRYNQQFVSILDDLRRTVNQQGIRLTSTQKDAYLERLLQTGAAAYAQFFPLDGQNYLTKLHDDYSQRGLSLTFMVPNTHSLLWEMLYTGDPLDDPQPEQFWGFRYPLGRIYLGIPTPPQYTIRLQEGIFSAIHDKLLSAKQEAESLSQLLAEICQHLKLPHAFRLLEQLLSADAPSSNKLLKLMVSHNFRYGVIHFACHCVNPHDSISGAYLRLTAHGQELQIHLEKLQSLQSRHHFVHQPFVFLNACQSATPGHLMQMLTFPTGILGFGAGGVIATACTMPDNFASEFATQFYERLLNRAKDSPDMRTNIGEALLETRHYFLEEYNNPLGLAYGLYAVSNQQLRLTD